jgi:hypothetical protein
MQRSSQDRSAEAGASEIELTATMLDAGVRAYRDRDSRVQPDREIVEEIFWAMMGARCPMPADKQ